MRALSGTLTTAQKAQASRPHPQVQAHDKIAGVTRHHWTRYYTGAEDDYFHAAAMPADGSRIRLRVDESTKTLYRQRVTSPGSGSTYSSWTDWSVDAFAVALASYGVNVWAFRIDATDGHLYRSDSTDSGATWGAWQDMGDVSGDSTFRLAACGKSLTEAIVIYGDGTDVYRRRLSGGAWEAAAAWSNTLASVSGVAVVHAGDWNVVVTGEEETTSRPGVWTTTLGDGYLVAADTWASLAELLVAESDASIAYKFPALDFPDVFRIFFVEDYDGSEAYSRPYWSHAPSSAEWDNNLWLEPVPFNLSSDYGLALCSESPGVWLCRPDGVWYATLAAGNVDITDDVLEIKATTGETRGEITLGVRNDDGRYDNISDASDTYEWVRLGAELQFSPGYHTTSGSSPEHSAGPRFWIDAYEYVSKGGAATLVIEAVDSWGLLDQWKARRQLTWAAGDQNIYQLIRFIVARAGFNLTTIGGGSTALTDLKPAFTINPGESGRTAVLRLLSLVKDVMWFYLSTAYLKEPDSADSSDYSYGTDHDILEAAYRTSRPDTNRAQVSGDGVFTEDFDWTSIDLVLDSLAQDHDLTLDSAARAHRRGDVLIRSAAIAAEDGFVLVPLNCGQEIYDVVTLTDARAPVSAVKRRAIGLQHTYQPKRGVYTLRIALGAV